MSLIKLFLIIITFPHQAEEAFHHVDWQSYMPPTPPPVEGMATTNSPAPADGMTVNPDTAKAAPDPKLDKDMMYQSLFGKSEDVAALIEKGGRVQATNDKGESALSVAAKRSNREGLEVLKVLLAGGADVDQRDKNGETPLFHAARAGNIVAVKLLLEAGTHYYWTNKDGDIARTYAFRGGYKDIVGLMDGFVLTSNAKTRAAAEEARRAAEAKRTAQDVSALSPPAPVDRAKQLALAEEVGLSACRYEYWFYVTQSGLETKLSPEQIAKRVDENRGAGTMLSTALIRELQFPAPSVEQLQQAATQSIFDELQRMESNINRNAKGVGTDADATARCTDIVDKILIPLKS